MTASMSKRQQARNERDLQDLINSVPGNDRCADCQARNPGWASWSLGAFLCMRCAALHRKLGTHVSKVKSLSMDTWSTDQVENMRKNGNVTVNKTYNPKNIKPGIPLDLDEVDIAMEKFIRQKYQERSLADGKPRPPSRDETPPPARSSRPPSPGIQVQPTKRGKIFGFKLRASSSAYPVSKRDTRNLPPLEPTIENSFRSEMTANKPSKPRVSDVSDEDRDHQDKLTALREMGFPDNKRNSAVLKRLSGDMTRTVESLVRLGEGGPDSRKGTPSGSIASRGNTPLKSTFPGGVSSQGPSPAAVHTNNPFDQPARAQTLAVPQPQGFYSPSFVQSPAQSASPSIDQAFQAMQVSQPLFPHSTGGYPRPQPPPMQDPRFQHSMTPPVTSVSQPNPYVAQSQVSIGTNPFLQQNTMQSHNPFGAPSVAQPMNGPFSAPATNPFFSQSPPPQIIQAPAQSSNLPSQNLLANPFGLPPSPQSAPAFQQQHHNPFQPQSPLPPSSVSQQALPPLPPNIQPLGLPVTSPSPFAPQQMANPMGNQISSNPFGPQFSLQPPPQNQPLPSSQYQFQPVPQSQPQPAPMQPQATGRYDKNSILALYNYPQLAPQPLTTIPDESASSFPSSTTTSPTPGSLQTSQTDTFSNPSQGIQAARRSATMPLSSMTLSPNSSTSKNPFLNLATSNPPSSQDTNFNSPGIAQQQQQQQQFQQPAMMRLGVNPIHRHASQESVSISNLENGRHSPDAFASLSARYVR